MEIKSKPFEPEILEQKLKQAYPDYFIKRLGKRMTVRKKKFTLTQQVGLVLNPEQGMVKTNTNMMMAVVFLAMAVVFSLVINLYSGIGFLMVAAYIFMKSSSIKVMEAEIAEKVKQILNA